MLSLIDFIFPTKCVGCGKFGEYFCDSCRKRIENVEMPICPICFIQAIGGKTHLKCRSRYSIDGLVFGGKYRGVVRKAISRVKYRWVYNIERDFVDLLADEIWQFDIVQKAILVPVPLHKKRENWKGFNQAKKLTENLSKKFKVSYKDILIRNRETKTQVG